MAFLLTLFESLVGPIVVRVVLALKEREADPEFEAKSLPAREKLRSATNAKGARDASLEIHRLLSGK